MDAVKNTIAENMGHGFHPLARPEHQFGIESDVLTQEGKVAVVTGGSEGISYGVTFTLLKQPLQTLHSQHVAGSRHRRTERHLRQARGTVHAQSPFMKCDLGVWAAS